MKPKTEERRGKNHRRRFILLSASSDNQPLLHVNHSWFKQENCGAEIRTLDAEVCSCSSSLRASAEGDVYVWDQYRRPEKRPATIEVSQGGQSSISELGVTTDNLRTDDIGGGSTRVASQIPRWNEAHQCLVMKFQRNRVKASSSKNFILFLEKDLTERRMSGKSDCAIMQFGKISHGKYALDFRQPIAPLQAFAMALSSFAFKPQT